MYKLSFLKLVIWNNGVIEKSSTTVQHLAQLTTNREDYWIRDSTLNLQICNGTYLVGLLSGSGTTHGMADLLRAGISDCLSANASCKPLTSKFCNVANKESLNYKLYASKNNKDALALSLSLSLSLYLSLYKCLLPPLS